MRHFIGRTCPALLVLLGVAWLAATPPVEAATEQEAPASQTATQAEGTPYHLLPSWGDAVRTTADDALYLVTSPLRLTPKTALAVGAVGAGLAGLALLDRDIARGIGHPQKDTLHDVASGISVLGYAPVLFGLNVGGIIIGKEMVERNDSPKFLNAALVATEAQLLTLVFSEGIGYATMRSRPSESKSAFHFKFGRDSFPSSHTSQAFAVAAVFADRYSDGPVPVIAYGLAGLVGVSRMIVDKHWASDVAAGAVLGWAIGKALSIRHSESHAHLDFFPFSDPATKTYGLVLHKEF